jgi:hypothetical protein
MSPPEPHLPAILQPGAPATSVDGHLVPALIADAGVVYSRSLDSFD